MQRAFLAILLVAHCMESSSAENVGCESRIDLVAACFDIRGRVSVYNGNPFVRVWPVGTNRLLGVETIIDETDCMCETFAAPENLKSWVGSRTEVFSDLRVCPLTEEKPGWMRFVCIEEAKNMRVEEVDEGTGKVEIIYAGDNAKADE